MITTVECLQETFRSNTIECLFFWNSGWISPLTKKRKNRQSTVRWSRSLYKTVHYLKNCDVRIDALHLFILHLIKSANERNFSSKDCVMKQLRWNICCVGSKTLNSNKNGWCPWYIVIIIPCKNSTEEYVYMRFHLDGDGSGGQKIWLSLVKRNT